MPRAVFGCQFMALWCIVRGQIQHKGEKTIDLYIELCKAFCPTIVTLVLAIVVWRKLPSKKDLRDGFDSISAEMTRYGDKLDANTRAIQGTIARFPDKMKTRSPTIWGSNMNANGARKMGGVSADVIISNPADRNKCWSGQFLVDTGATDSLVPRQRLEAIGIRPEASRTYVLADGTEIRMDVAIARIEVMGEIVGGTVLFGDENTEPLLGVTALESLGIIIDPLNQQLEKLPAVGLKRQLEKQCSVACLE